MAVLAIQEAALCFQKVPRGLVGNRAAGEREGEEERSVAIRADEPTAQLISWPSAHPPFKVQR
jgi:hypothetical protein